MDEAREFLRAYYQAFVEEKIQHSERVLRVCDEIADLLRQLADVDLNRELLRKAAILHDIAKFDNKGLHHKLAADVICEHQLSSIPENEGERIGKIIRAHKGDTFKPGGWENALLAAILRMADKIDKAVQKGDQETVDENLDIIHQYFKEKKKERRPLPVTFKVFQRACKAAEGLERNRKGA